MIKNLSRRLSFSIALTKLGSIAILFFILFVACTSQHTQAGDRTDSLSSETRAVSEIQTPTPEALNPTPIPTEASPTSTGTTSASCNEKKGNIEQNQVDSSLLLIPMSVRVYLPPCYTQERERRYPVLYLLHGQNFTDEQWDRIGADDTADRLITTGEAPPFIIVMPYDPSLTNPDVSPFGRAFIQDLVPWVDTRYRTNADRAHRAIGGLSRGSAWAVHIGLSEWKLFSSIGVHSGFYFRGEGDLTKRWIEIIPQESIPRIYVDIGSDDRLREANDEFENLLLSLQIPHEWYVFPGRHEESYWKKHVEQYLRWYTAAWK
jgi:enterochelin esterase-like enzyme